MLNAIPPLAMLKAFEAFGREGGIRKAARSLDVDHAIVSRHLRALEELLGTALIDRGLGENQLTPDGAAYHARLSAALHEIAVATQNLRTRNDKRLLVWSAPGFALHWLNPQLDDFQRSFPQFALELRPSDKSPDFSVNEADADLRYIAGGPPVLPKSLKSLELLRPLVFPVASPEYAARFAAKLRQPGDLLHCCLLHEEDDSEWALWLAHHDVVVQRPIDGPRLWHAHLSLDAARGGRGVALANKLLLRDDLTTGRLVPLLPPGARYVAIGAYHFIGREDRWRLPRIARFREWLSHTMPGEQ